jgi:Icc-related predicted phosphoesterase
MRLIHVSDTHGGFPRLHGKYDCVVHTGDFFPDGPFFKNGTKAQIAVWQMKWLEDHIDDMKQQLQGHPYLFIEGNHDFVNPQMVEMFLNSEGIKAIDLIDKIVNHEGINFYGFPYVPAINGQFNYEREIPEMQQEMDKMIAAITSTYSTYVDVWVCHAPPHQTLDLSHGNMILGSSVIATALDYQIPEEKMPTHYLCGHIHDSHGITMRKDVLVSNAATTYHILEL